MLTAKIRRIASRKRLLTATLLGTAATLTGCDLFLGIQQHSVAADASAAVDSSRLPDATPSDVRAVDAKSSMDATKHDAGSIDAGKDHATAPVDASPDTSVVDAQRDVAIVDAAPVCAPDADFTNDPANCGRCGHGCLEAGCAASACQPKVVSIATGIPNFLTIADSNIYWTQISSGGTSPNAVMIAPAAGGNAVVVHLLAGPGWGVGTDTERLYWGITGNNNYNTLFGVYQCPLAGCTDAGPQLIGPADYYQGSSFKWDSLDGFTVTSDVLYVATQQGFLNECPLPPVDGGGCKAAVSGLNSPASPRADDAGVVWANQGNPLSQNQFNTGSIETCSPSGSCPTPTPMDPSIQPQFLAISPTYVVWTEVTANTSGHYLGNVMSCLRNACEENLVTLATNQVFPQGIAMDKTRAYWADQSAGTVLSCPIGGCPDGGPTVLSTSDAGMPFQVALDDSAVYWTNQVPGGAIMRVAKP